MRGVGEKRACQEKGWGKGAERERERGRQRDRERRDWGRREGKVGKDERKSIGQPRTQEKSWGPEPEREP